MEVVFFTEANYEGKINRNNPNMRTDLAWVCALNADHCNINSTPKKLYDLGVVIIPKKNPSVNFSKLQQFCHKISIMQEGPNWYWQDYNLNQQVEYFNTIQEADFMFVHNSSDKKYYEGLTGKKCEILPSLMIEDSISNLFKSDRENIIIGGNFCSWYGGFDSYIVAQEANCPIYTPSMGRKIKGEEQMPNLNHLPYMHWVDWIKTLNNFKFGVHLMRTHAAGTFALNCAFLGIPCLGYKGLDTQDILHPELTVELGDLVSAKEKLKLLNSNEEFYNECSSVAIEKYKKYYSETCFLKQINKIYNEN